MQYIVTEDTIKKALDESINEFMINEGQWGDAFKSAWNGVKNAAAMYMDWRTNGQWNNKYGIYANGTGKTTEMYYLNKWFNYHVQQIQDVAKGMQSPNKAQNTIQWSVDDNGKQVGTQTINNYNDISQYVSQNINSRNFNMWAGQYIKNRKGLTCIDGYIDDNKDKIKDVKSAIDILNTGAFLSSKYYGEEYLKLTNTQRQNGYNVAQKYSDEDKQAYNQELEKSHEGIKTILSQVSKSVSNYTRVSKGLIDKEIKYISNQAEQLIPQQNIRSSFVSWVWSVLYQNQMDMKAASSILNIKNFLSSQYGMNYNLK